MTREKGFLEESTFRKIIQETAPCLEGLGLYHYGEPLLHKNIHLFIGIAKKAGIDEVKISTNTIPLKKEGAAEKLVQARLDYLLMCIEGITPESYAFYRREGSLDEALQGIRNMVQAKKGHDTPLLDLQFIIMKHNEDQVEDFRCLARDLGVDKVSLKNCDVGLTIKPFHSIMYDYLPEKKENSIKKILENKDQVPSGCSQIWRSCIILWNGDVVPCCYDWDGKYIFGNVNNERFRDIWNNREYVKFRKQVSRDRSAIEMCALCPEGRGGLFYEE